MEEKIIISGHVIEHYRFERQHKGGKKGGRKNKEKAVEDDYYNDNERQRVLSNNRTRNNIRRLILSNFTDEHSFITLTFAENLTHVSEGHYQVKKFIQRLKYRKGKGFKYLFVVEFQQRGAVHYHGFVNMDLEEQELEEIWGKGFITCEKVFGVDNVGAYLTKYMTKELYDERLTGEKAYLRSRNLDKPMELKGYDALKILSQVEKYGPVYSNYYDSEYTGRIEYKEYNLRRNKNNEDRA